MPIFTSFGGTAISIGFDVQGKERVEVPAGKFNCFKVLLPTPVNQTFWFSNDEHHYPVKINANGVVMPLVKVERLVPGKTRKYSDAAIALSLPSGWYVYHKGAGLYKNEPGLTLLTPDVDWEIQIATITLEKLSAEMNIKLEKLSAEPKKSLRASAEQGLSDMAKQLKDLKVRADSWQSMTLSGQPAASYVADFVGTDGRSMALYVVCVFGKTTAASITVNCPRDGLDHMKKAIRPVLESFEVK